MNARIGRRVHVGMAISIVAMAGCSCMSPAIVEPPGACVTVANPQLCSRTSVQHHFVGNGFLRNVSEPSIKQDPWTGSAWEGYRSEKRGSPKAPFLGYPFPSHGNRPNAGPSPLLNLIETSLNRLDLLLGPRQTAFYQNGVSPVVLSPNAAQERNMPPSDDSFQDRDGNPKNQSDSVPPTRPIVPRNAVPAKGESLQPIQIQIREEVPPDTETKKNAGQVDDPPPSSIKKDSPRAPAVPRNDLPKRVAPPASNTPPRNAIPSKSGQS